MSKPKVLFALTSHNQLGDTGKSTGAYIPEVSHPAAVFVDGGYDVEFVSVKGGQPPADGIKDDDKVTAVFLADPIIQAKLMATPTAGQLDPASYNVIYFAGGHGTMWDFADATDLAALASSIYASGGVIAAVCHGPAGLIGVKDQDGNPIVAGKSISCFTNEEENAVGLADIVPFLLESKLIGLGGKHTKADNFKEHAVVDQRLVTGQNPASAVKVAHLALAALNA